jgi:hypothetical protein
MDEEDEEERKKNGKISLLSLRFWIRHLPEQHIKYPFV